MFSDWSFICACRPGQEGTSKEPPYWVTERTQEVFQRSSKRTIERGRSEDTPNSAGVQVHNRQCAGTPGGALNCCETLINVGGGGEVNH